MPRRLPWLTNDTATTSRGKATTSSKSHHDDSVKRQKVDSKGDEPLQSGQSGSPHSPTSKENEGIREGYDADDIWMMVEDEFLATAQLYTKHLHHAEYLRLQQEAEEREIRQPSHATAGSVTHKVPTKGTIRRKSSSDEDGIAIDHPTLANLMQSPRKKPELLRRGTMDTPQTPSRRKIMNIMEEAPYKKDGVETAKAVEEDDETDDDLDAPIRNYLPPQRRVVEERRKSTSTRHSPPVEAVGTGRQHGRDSMAAMLAKRRSRTKGKQEAEASTNETTTEIPTFLY